MIRSHYTHIQLELLEPREGVNVYTKWLGGAGLCLPSHNDNIIDIETSTGIIIKHGARFVVILLQSAGMLSDLSVYIFFSWLSQHSLIATVHEIIYATYYQLFFWTSSLTFCRNVMEYRQPLLPTVLNNIFIYKISTYIYNPQMFNCLSVR